MPQMMDLLWINMYLYILLNMMFLMINLYWFNNFKLNKINNFNISLFKFSLWF